MLPMHLMVNRELSWLEFNKRCLSEALRQDVPLFERLKFAAIYFSNLDEFFMVRVGSLTDQSMIEPNKLDDKTGFTADAPACQLGAQHIKTNAAQFLLFALCPKGT